jgi:hypothetical protein
MSVLGFPSNSTIFSELVAVARIQSIHTTQLLAIQTQLSVLVAAQTKQSDQLAAIMVQGKATMATIADIQADVTSQNTVIGSAVTLLQGLKAALDAAGTDPAALQAVKDSLDANTASLAAAVVANTPGAPPPAQAAQQAQAATQS